MKYILYTGPNCTACITMKHNLEAAKIHYTERDISHKDAAREASKLYIKSLPALVVMDGDKVAEILLGSRTVNVLMGLKHKGEQ